jgi:hypothetical protein
MPTQDATTAIEHPDEASSSLSDHRGGLAAGSPDILSQWLELAMSGPRTASGTVRKFVDTIDKVVPLDDVGLAQRRQVVTAALEMTQRLVHAPYDLGRSLVQSAVLVNVDVGVDVDVASTTTIDREDE